ncbi:lipid II:glycine glycyltransferase FemX [Parvularcula marina]|uniref:lipid II:glycine glycyltransferase FemX n=2 Tax=Parvularcula marina TaxID=2292771 RepID=UPI003559AD3F
MPFDAPQTTMIRWNGLSAKAWDKQLVRAAFAPCQQAHAFGEVIAAHGGEVLRAELVTEGETAGLCQVAVRKFPGFRLATAMMGPVWLNEGLPEGARAAMIDELGRTLPIKGFHAFLLMPQGEGSGAEEKLRLRRVVSPYHTVLLDLTQDEEALLAEADGKWRNRLRAAEKAGLTVNPLGRRAEQYKWLLEAERRQQKRLGYRALSPLMVPAWQEKAGKDSVIGFEAKLGAERVAGMLLFRHGATATYHIGWASKSGRDANAMNLLLWQSIRQLKKKGVTMLDLGGVDTDHAPGVARFKLGTGGRLISQSGTWLLRPRLR